MVLVAILVFVNVANLCFGQQNHAKLKNIIVMISDGCGYNHVEAASLYQYGKRSAQIYESFPVKYVSVAYLNIGWGKMGGSIFMHMPPAP